MTGKSPAELSNGTPYGPPPEGSGLSGALDALDVGRAALGQEFDRPDDESIIRDGSERFMKKLYGNDRYTEHNQRMLEKREEWLEQAGVARDPDLDTLDATTIYVHDLVDHGILHPEKTAERLGLGPAGAAEIYIEAVDAYIKMLEKVEDKDTLRRAFGFAIDASKWELPARVWRSWAEKPVQEQVDSGQTSPEDADIWLASINKTPELDNIDNASLERVLRNPDRILPHLSMEDINKSILDHNIRGLVIKSLEMLVNIRHPAADNPSATYRDCIEVLNFFAPALMWTGHKELAINLRDVALRWFYDDPDGSALNQNAATKAYSEDIESKVFGLLESDFSGVDLKTGKRIKSQGSLRKKYTEPEYRHIRKAADGHGITFEVPNDMAGEEMTRFAEEYARKLAADPQIGAGHPVGSAFDNMQGERKRPSGYEAIHMTFYYYPTYHFPMVGPLAHAVPVEIQVLTQEQHEMKLYGPYSDIPYKALGTFWSEEEYSRIHLAKRGAAENELPPGTTIQSLVETVSISPEKIPDVYNDLFRVVERHGARVLVPIELAETAHELPDEFFSDRESVTVIPPNIISETQFLEAIDRLGKGLAQHQSIQNALELVREAEAGEMRNNGTTPVFEGHILPTALTAAMISIQSGKIWEGELNALDELSNIITIALLHDYVEKRMEKAKGDINLQIAIRESTLIEVKHQFGATISDSVRALSVPVEIEDEVERRNQYTLNIEADRYAPIIKAPDRNQNLMTDIIKFISGEIDLTTPEGQKELKRIVKYWAKNDRHMHRTLTSEVPDEYARMYAYTRNLAIHAGLLDR